jgi:hypothetical protein
MKIAQIATLGAALLSAACATTRRVETTSTGSTTATATSGAAAAVVSPGNRVTWTATLAPQGTSHVSGTATVSGVSGASETRATITLKGATAGGVHPWHIHSGKCGSKGAIVGPPTAYPAITVGQDSSAKIDATLPFAVPRSGSYYVNIHASPTDMGTIVACGDLTTASAGNGTGR